MTKSQAIMREMEINRGRPTRCSVCGCTYDRACASGCSWVHKPGEMPICSVCSEMGARIALYLDDANRVTTASLSRLLGLAKKGSGAVGRALDARLKSRKAGV